MSARRRSRHVEEHDRNDRWLVSYADFITLLFALFVVMYSVSSVNAGKYRILSDTLNAVFADPQNLREAAPPERSTGALLPGGASALAPTVADGGEQAAADALEAASRDPVQRSVLDTQISRARDRAGAVAALRETLNALLPVDGATVREVTGGVEIELPAGVLFNGGSARVSDAAAPVLAHVAELVAKLPGTVRVEGHTDDRPIATREFASNWELSAARAAAVVRGLVQRQVAPARLVAVGYADHRPVADNGSREGRARNRRVLIVVTDESAGAGGEGGTTPPVPGELSRIDALPGREGPDR
ncbi:MAG: OmpA family protein [Gammaproteobacteria bacterium]|nr:OmpA family protein [Gammaproteobacteria bacterium]